jgi:hypothetical protein
MASAAIMSENAAGTVRPPTVAGEEKHKIPAFARNR